METNAIHLSTYYYQTNSDISTREGFSRGTAGCNQDGNPWNGWNVRRDWGVDETAWCRACSWQVGKCVGEKWWSRPLLTVATTIINTSDPAKVQIQKNSLQILHSFYPFVQTVLFDSSGLGEKWNLEHLIIVKEVEWVLLMIIVNDSINE